MSAVSESRAALSPRAADARGPVAIVDIGSNSVRLVIYESQSRNAATLAERKIHLRHRPRHGDDRPAACRRLRRGAGSAGALPHDLPTASRSRLREAVATAAARDASNGAEFIARAEQAWGAPIRVLAGEDEARIAAEGVVAGIPEASGLVADLGGGSLDMVTVKGGKTGEAWTIALRAACG